MDRPFAQRDPADVAEPDSPPQDAAPMESVPAASSPAPGASSDVAPAAAGDLDELARRLYGRIRVHLRHELRLDRERTGSLVGGAR